MTDRLGAALDTELKRAEARLPGVRAEARLPGIAAIVTDRNGTLWEGAAGHRSHGSPEPMTPDTVLSIYSATKPITATAILQLVEQGLLDLDAPAKRYMPALGDAQVIDGVEPDGTLRLRPPARDITLRMLLLHTAGFGYDFCNAHYRDIARKAGLARLAASPATLLQPLLFDPGTDWHYGANIEWAGLILEQITGQRLGDYLRQHIFAPLGMHDTAFAVSPAMGERLGTLHQRTPDGGLVAQTRTELPPPPEWDRGGGGLYSTARDYARFMRLWLGDGAGILRPETIDMAVRNGLGDIRVRMLPGIIPELSNDAEFFPGMPKGWALSFMTNEHDAPTGRPAGSLAWAGLGNLYFWIDRKTGIAGFWGTQLLPFVDPAAIEAFTAFETAAYKALSPRERVR